IVADCRPDEVHPDDLDATEKGRWVPGQEEPSRQRTRPDREKAERKVLQKIGDPVDRPFREGQVDEVAHAPLEQTIGQNEAGELQIASREAAPLRVRTLVRGW